MATTEVIVEAYLQSSTGLPKDRFINVWHFLDTTGAAPVDVCRTGMAKIADFFTGASGISGVGNVGQNLQSFSTNTMHMIGYDFAAATPRPEIAIGQFTFAPATNDNLPEEIALCLSYYTDRNLASKRGRLYIGPFNVQVLDTTGEPPRPATTATRAMQAGGIRLVAIGTPVVLPPTLLVTPAGSTNTSTAWALYSPKLGTFAAIQHGWVDNEWDGQSRRRVEASTRLSW
jgi:hypothetical protein